MPKQSSEGEFPSGRIAKNVRRIAFASPHCLADCTSGAAVATASGLRFLRTLGFDCEAFCGSRLDSGESLEKMLARHQIPWQVTHGVDNSAPTYLLVAAAGDVKTTIFRLRSVPGQAAYEREAAAFLGAYGSFLDTFRPDALLCYGGEPIARAIIEMAKSRNIAVVFWLHNFGYTNPATFASVDRVIVPSEFNRRYYSDHLGLSSQVVPLVVDWPRVKAASRQLKYL